MADDACTERMGGQAVTTRSGGRADERMRRKGCGRLGGRGRKGCGQWSGRADERTGRSGPPLHRRRVGWTGGRAGRPGFKRPHSTRLTSLLGAQSACLVRAQVRRVLGSAVGSNTIPRQTLVLSARTHLPRLSASVLGAEKGILLSNPKNGFTQRRW